MPLRITSSNLYLLLGAGLVLVALLGALALFWGPTPQQATYSWLLLLFTALVAALAARRRIQGEFDWFEPGLFMAVVYLLFFGFAGLRFVANPSELHPFLQGDQSWLSWALFFVLLGILAFWAGYYGRWGLTLHKLTHNPGREWLRSQATIRGGVVAGIYLVGLAARLFMLRQGIYGYLRDPEYFATVPYGEFFVRVEAFCGYALVLAWIDWYSHPKATARRLFALSLLGSEMLWGFFSGMKMNVILPLLFVAMIYTYKRGRLPVRYVASAFLIAIMIYPVNTLYRTMVSSGELEIRTPMDMIASSPVLVDELLFQFDDPGLYWESGYDSALRRASMIQSYALLLKYLDQTDAYWHGRYVWMLPALIVVPRAVWHDKPVSNIGYWFSVNVWGLDPHVQTSMAITYPGDLYLQFGLPSLFVGMFLTGIVLRWVYERYGRPRSDYALFIYIFVFYQLVAHEPDVVLKVAGTLRVFLIVLALSLLAFRFPRRATAMAAAGTTDPGYRPTLAGPQPA